MFIEIIEHLRKVRDKIEDLDDSAMNENLREDIGKAHFYIEQCIVEIEGI